MKILLTSTSFQDTPGKHHDLLNQKGFEITELRGPLPEKALLELNWDFDGIVCGDDEYTRLVLEKAKKGGLKVLSKYGVGLDKMDLIAAQDMDIKVVNCKGVNQTTVSEHVFGLLLNFFKNISVELEHTKEGNWVRLTGEELKAKRLLIVGLGKIGKEVAKVAKVFGMEVFAFDKFFDTDFAREHGIKEVKSLDSDLTHIDVISLHCNLDDESKGLINHELLFKNTSNDVVLVNTARAHLVEKESLLDALREKVIRAALFDVWFDEPMSLSDATKYHSGLYITPHISSRTRENVENQGSMAVDNLFNALGV